MNVHAERQHPRLMSTAFQSKFSDNQRAAVVSAYIDRGVRPMSAIPRMAAAGELTLHGVSVPPFDVGYGTARGWIKTEERRRSARVQVAPEDQLEALRNQLLSVARLGVEDIERKQKKGQTDWELIRQVARAMREIKAIPGKDQPRGIKPGGHDPNTGTTNGGRTEGGLAGAVLAAARTTPRQEAPAPERPSPHEAHAENRDAGPPSASGETEQDEAPGSAQRSEQGRRSTLLRT